MKLLATTGLVLFAMLPNGAGLGKGMVDDRPGPAQARGADDAGGRFAKASGMTGRMGSMAGRTRLPNGLQVKSLKCLDAQEPLGDEIELRIKGKTLWSAVGMAEGSVRTLTYLKPFPLDGQVDLELWEDDPTFMGWFGDDLVGDERLEDLDPGTYTTTFHGNGGVYELTFEVQRPDRDRLMSRDRSRGGRAGQARGSERMRRPDADLRSSEQRSRRLERASNR